MQHSDNRITHEQKGKNIEDPMKKITKIPKLPKRRRDSHKGDYGRVLIIAGSYGMSGAAYLATKAALRSGAGLVSLAAPRSIIPMVVSQLPCATYIGLDEKEGKISYKAISDLARLIIQEKKFDSIAIGPGLSNAEGIEDLIYELINAAVPTVIDADGLNILARTNWQGRLYQNCIITPHPGELARLLKLTTQDIQKDRLSSALRAVKLMKGEDSSSDAICVLKGYRSIVTDGNGYYINTTGNPGMATGGSGDVLTGIIASLLAQGLKQGLKFFDVAILSVYIHGLAGDLAAKKLTEYSLIASDIIDYLPPAIKTLGKTDK